MALVQRNPPLKLPYLKDNSYFKSKTGEPDLQGSELTPFKNNKYQKILKNIINDNENSPTDTKGSPYPQKAAKTHVQDHEETEKMRVAERKLSEGFNSPGHPHNLYFGSPPRFPLHIHRSVPRSSKIPSYKGDKMSWDPTKRPHNPFQENANGGLIDEKNSPGKDFNRGGMLVEATSIVGSNRKDDTPLTKTRKNATTDLPSVHLNTESDNKKDGFETPKNTRIANGYKINSLTPVYNKVKEEQRKPQVNFDLLFQIEAKLHIILTDATNLNQVKKSAREYLELVEKEEVCAIEVLFMDAKIRRNLKTYSMLERLAAVILLMISEDERDNKDEHIYYSKNISQYMYSNFLNFVDMMINKVTTTSDSDVVDRLKQFRLKTLLDLDNKSMSLESVNRLLLKILRSCVTAKNVLSYKIAQLDLLLEKIEFGLSLNFAHQLKIILEEINKQSQEKQDTDNQNTSLQGMQNQTTDGKLEGDKSVKKTNSKLFLTPQNPRKTNGLGEPKKNFHLPPLMPDESEPMKPIYSLILDLDETLIHYEEVGGKGRFYVRPYAEKFLEEMAQHYELTVFTAAVQDYADTVLNILDPHKHIKHRLYRQHTIFRNVNGTFIKDLSKLGRDLQKTIIIDNSPENFRLQQDNGIEIKSWYNDPYDTELLELMPFLKGLDLVIKQIEDVRKPIKQLKQKRKFKRLK